MYPRPNESGEQAILNIDFTLNYYIQNGYPANKINLGLATYGRSFTLFVNSINNLGATTVGGGTAGQVCKKKFEKFLFFLLSLPERKDFCLIMKYVKI